MHLAARSAPERWIPIAPLIGGRRVRASAPARELLALTLAAITGFAFVTPPVAASPSLETFVLAAGGISNPTFDPPCTGGGSPDPVYDFFGVWGVGIPTAGLDLCSVQGGIDDLTSATGPLPGSRSITSSWPAIATNFFTGSSSATSNYGRLSAQGHAEFDGEDTNRNVTGAEGFGLAHEVFTITSPSIPDGQTGTILFRVTLTGGFSLSAFSQAGVQLYNRFNAGQNYSLLTSYVFYPTSIPNLSSHDGAGLGGFTLSPGAMNGSGEVASGATSIVFGTPFDYRLGLLAYAVNAHSSIVDSHFDALITGVEVRNSGGQIVSDFVVTSGSGTPYGPGGSAAVEDLAQGRGGDAIHLSAFPNPSSTRMVLSFNLPRAIATSLDIYDASGRRVRQLDHETRAGSHSVAWDGRNDRGLLTAAGLYFARLSSREGIVTTRLMVLR